MDIIFFIFIIAMLYNAVIFILISFFMQKAYVKLIKQEGNKEECIKIWNYYQKITSKIAKLSLVKIEPMKDLNKKEEKNKKTLKGFVIKIWVNFKNNFEQK